jgi:cullin-5
MPADYVNKLARMFQDIKVSEDLNQEFKEAHRNNNEGLAGKLIFMTQIKVRIL